MRRGQWISNNQLSVYYYTVVTFLSVSYYSYYHYTMLLVK